jgi:hypothetical protein
MTPAARKELIRRFKERNKFPARHIPSRLGDIIAVTSAPYFLFVECLDQLDPNHPTGGHLIKWATRVHDTAQAAFALIALGHLREAEVLARSLYESSATLTYLVENDPNLRIPQFFLSYIQTERAQNRKWEADLHGAPVDIQVDHRERIAKKNEFLDAIEGIITSVFSRLPIDNSKLHAWPEFIDRLTSMGYRLEYRTVYMAMCSQAHHDAEDMINYYLSVGFPVGDDAYQVSEEETDTFSIFMLLFALRWFVKAMSTIATYLNMPTVKREAEQSLERMMNELQVTAAHFSLKKMPKGWVN